MAEIELPPTTTDAIERFRLQEQVAIITGSTRGIGLAIATALAGAGARVVVSSRKIEHVDSTVAAFARAGLQAIGIAANIGRIDDAHALVRVALETYGRIDIIINNAATNPVFGPLQQAGNDVFDKIFAVNVKGPLELCRAAHGALAARGGSIVNIASIGGVSPEPGLGLYSMSKAALISLTKVMAQEWGADGIRANVICPGLIRTRFSAALWTDEMLAHRTLDRQPVRRIGVPDDVAGLALFLASDAAAYCTGGVYMVDGGYLL